MLGWYYLVSAVGTVVLLLIATRRRHIRLDDFAACLILGFAGGWLLWPLAIYAAWKRA